MKQHMISTIVTESQMTIKYLKDGSTMLAVVIVVREVDLKRNFSAERDILELIFAFDLHIYNTRHIMYQHVHLNNLLEREKILQRIS